MSEESARYKHLFTPLKIGPMTVRNRIVNTAHGLRYAENHLPSERHLYYHMERAKGGVGLSIMESTSVHPTSISFSGSDLWNHNDSIIPVYERLSEAVHKYGGRIMAELNHAGRQQKVGTEHPLVAPSSIPTYLRPTQVPRELEPEQIREIADAFGKSALRCKKGGLDGAELHGAHGNLIEQFLSPLTNRRTDSYGGSVENRVRFAVEVLESVRKYVGEDFVVGMRINGSELAEGGLTNLDMQEIAWRLEQTGLLNYFSVSMGHYLNLLVYGHQIPDMSYRPGVFVHLAAAIKKVVKLPVFAVGRINHPDIAERILSSGQADMVGMVRALIADPHLPNKAKEGRLEDIRFCVGAMECIGDVRGTRPPVTCIQNPITSREKEWSETPLAKVRKKVVVVGGGPGGLEAARVAALRGHKVTLFEKGRKLGGQVLIAAKAPVREELAGIVDYQSRQIEKLGVDVKLGVEATAELVLSARADAVVIATGAHHAAPEFEGAGADNVVSVFDVLDGRVEAGKNVVLFDELGDQQAFGAAEYLAVRGRKVEFVTRLPYAGINITPLSWRVQYQRMLELGIIFTPFMWIKRVEGNRVVITNDITSSIERAIEGVDTMVLSLGTRPNDGLYRQLKGKVAELHLIGDALAPRGIQQAIYEGQKVARLI